MKLYILTIVLDGQPFISQHINEFDMIRHDWEWWIVEGASSNNADTRWCAKQSPRLSMDGTTEYIRSLALTHPNVHVIQSTTWNSKTSMVNAALANFRDSGVLMQVDVDEFWTASQLDKIVTMFENDSAISHARFFCNYFLGPGIISGSENSYGNNNQEWLRAWRFKRGMLFKTHEPPVLAGNRGIGISRDQTRNMGLVFNHYAWLLESQIRYKEFFYNYTNAVDCWKRLQSVKEFPVKLKNYLHWTDENATAIRIDEPKTASYRTILQSGRGPDEEASRLDL